VQRKQVHKKISILFLIFFSLSVPPRLAVARQQGVLIAQQSKELEESKKRLLQIQQQINEEKEREEKVRVAERKEKQALETVNKNLVKTEGELKKYKNKIFSTKKNLKIAEIDLKKKERDFRDYQDLLAGRISAFFRNIFFPLSQLDEIEQDARNPLRKYLNSLSSDCILLYSAMDLGRELKVFGVFASENADLIRETEFQKKTIEDKKKTLKTEEVKLTRVKVVKEKEKQELESKKKEKEVSISRAKAELKKSQRKQEQLRKTARELEAMIKRLAAQKGVPPEVLKKEAMLFEKDKDNLPWPVSRGKVVSYFGWTSTQQYTASIFNPGIGIEVSGNENVYAVSKGKVMYSDSFRSYGKTIIIDHGGGYCSVYSGLDKISVKTGQEMKSGEIIGSISSNMHFEMRKDAKAIDPLEWLKNK